VQITVEPEQDADQGRHAEPNRDVEDVHSGTNLAPQMAIYRLAPSLAFPSNPTAARYRRHKRSPGRAGAF
jgi:hypothetical protein